jgi:LmbE family N-acetylglucosaminyl deacetylase
MTPDDIAACREVEALKACAQLGVNAQDVVFLHYTDGSTAEHMDKIIADLRSQIEDFSPGCLFSPFGIDSHSDHRSVAVAVDRLSRAGIITCPIYEYPVWFWSFGAWRGTLFSLFRKGNARSFGVRSLLRPRTVSSADCRDRKRATLAAYCSQVTNQTGEPGWQTLSPWFLRHFFGTQELFFEKPMPLRTRRP